MDVSVSAQAYMFLAMVVCGVFCGLIFDLFRSIRRAHRCRNGVVAIQDIVFWFAELVLVYTVAFRLNYAKVRAYEAVALVIGSVLYFMTISFYVVKFLSAAMAVAVKLGKTVFKPFVNLVNLLKRYILVKKNNLLLKTKTVFAKIKELFKKIKLKHIKKNQNSG